MISLWGERDAFQVGEPAIVGQLASERWVAAPGDSPKPSSSSMRAAFS